MWRRVVVLDDIYGGWASGTVLRTGCGIIEGRLRVLYGGRTMGRPLEMQA